MITEKFWSKNRFPIVYENDEEKAIMIDIESYKKIELILDNLINREEESEDKILVASDLLKKLISETRKTTSDMDWRTELNAI